MQTKMSFKKYVWCTIICHALSCLWGVTNSKKRVNASKYLSLSFPQDCVFYLPVFLVATSLVQRSPTLLKLWATAVHRIHIFTFIIHLYLTTRSNVKTNFIDNFIRLTIVCHSQPNISQSSIRQYHESSGL